jgi:cysteine desulfurase / selenocysteine lyase
MFNVEAVRADFPILHQQINGHPLVYFDNAATTQKPQSVIDAISYYYAHDNANVHRGVHTLSHRATDACEKVRDQVRAFINAPTRESIIFTQGATDSVNLVMHSWASYQIKTGENILLTEPEHHSNLVPWQMLAERMGAQIRTIPLLPSGELDLSLLDTLIDSNTRLVAVQHMSNVLGTIHDIERIITAAHRVGARVLVDAAQSIPHLATDVQALDIDFLVFSAHKMLGPTGIGVLYARPEILEQMPPYRGGGAMIKEVWMDRHTWGDLPFRFEAGTPHMAGIVGLGAAITYLENLGLDAVLAHEQMLLRYALEQLKGVESLDLYGPEDNILHRGGIISFNLQGIHAQDVGEIMDQQGIAIRTGHHCCQPLMRHYQVSTMARASFYIYNTHAEVDVFVAALQRTQRLLTRRQTRQNARQHAKQQA